MDAWLQKPDFSADELTFADCAAAQAYWNSLDKDVLDEEARELTDAGSDWCPWGLGIGFGNANVSVHIHRQDAEKDTFTVNVTQTVKKKLLGFIPITTTEEDTQEDVPGGSINELLEKYFKMFL